MAMIVIVNLSRCTYVSDDSADVIFARASYFAVIAPLILPIWFTDLLKFMTSLLVKLNFVIPLKDYNI